jgi:DNA polymerase
MRDGERNTRPRSPGREPGGGRGETCGLASRTGDGQPPAPEGIVGACEGIPSRAPSRRDLALYLADLGWRDIDAGAATAAADRAVPPEHAAARSPQAVPAASAAAAVRPQPPGPDPLAAASLAAMAAALAGCRRCRLCQGRSQVVFGAGDPHARVMFVGEGPGADEDRLGEPFVGRAGQLLTSMLRAIGLRREEVYIANVVKCRPPGNRDPEDDEAGACLPFLWRQIELIDPRAIVLLGKVAAGHFLGTRAPISTYRGRWQTARGRAVLPTFHPAYLLRNPAAKAQSWADLKQLRRALDSSAVLP